MDPFILKKLEQILSKATESRDYNDNEFLILNLVRNIPIVYEKFSNQFHKVLATAFKFQRFRKGTVIFEQNQQSDSLLMILKGSIICIQEKDPNNCQQFDPKVKQLQYLKNIKGDIQDSIRLIEAKIDNQCVVLRKYKETECINQIEFFQDLNRPFYAICQKECEVAIVYKTDLEQQVKNDKQKYERGQKNIDFIKKVGIFKEVEQESIFKEIYFNSREEKYRQDQMVYNLTYPSDYFYIVKEGSFGVYKEHRLSSIENMENVKVRINKKDQNKDGLFNKMENNEIQVMKEGQVFGLDECILNCTRRHQVVCSSQKGLLLMVNKHFLMKRLINDGLVKKNIYQEIDNQQRLEHSLQYDYELGQKKNQIELLRQVKMGIPRLDQRNGY